MGPNRIVHHVHVQIFNAIHTQSPEALKEEAGSGFKGTSMLPELLKRHLEVKGYQMTVSYCIFLKL